MENVVAVLFNGTVKLVDELLANSPIRTRIIIKQPVTGYLMDFDFLFEISKYLVFQHHIRVINENYQVAIINIIVFWSNMGTGILLRIWL